MDLYRKKIAGIIGLVISMAARVKTHQSQRNDGYALLAYTSNAFVGFFEVLSQSFCSFIHHLNGRFSTLLQNTPGFFENKCHPALFFCKSKRAGSSIHSLKPGAFSPLCLQVSSAARSSVLVSPGSLLLRRLIGKPSVFFGILLLVAFAGNVNALTITSTGTGGDWNEGSSWVGGVVPSSGDDIVIANGATITISSATSCNSLTIGGTLSISGSDTLQVNGNWTNNGIFTANSSAVTFTGSVSATISGTSASAFHDLIINKGSSRSTLLEVNATGGISVSGNFNPQNGLFKLTAGTVNLSASAGFTISLSAGIQINGTTAILTSGDFSIINNGLFQVISGTAFLGQDNGNSLQTDANGIFQMDGGTINIAGRLVNTAGIAIVSGGTINLSTMGHANSTYASFDMSITTDLNISGGTLIFHKANSSITAPLDISIKSGGTKSITGGTFQIGSVSTTAGSIFKINSAISIYNLTVNAFNTPSLQLTGNDLILSNQLTMNGGNIDGATNSKTVILTNPNINSISQTSGYITGQMRRVIGNAGGTAYVYPVGNGLNYTPLILNFSGADNDGSITVSSIAGDLSLAGSLLNWSTRVHNYWTIENSGVTFSALGGDFIFPSGIADAGTYKVGVYNGSTWSYPSVSSSTSTSVSFTGLPSLSSSTSFALAGCIPPTITLDANPVICEGTTSTSLNYSAVTGSPNQYRIDFDAVALAAGFVSLPVTPFPASPITLSISAAIAPGTYNATLFVRNASDCESSGAPFSIIINPTPTVNAGGAIAAICQGGTTAALGGSFGGGATSAVWTAPSGTFANNSGNTPGTATFTAATNSTTPITLTLTTVGGSCGTTTATKDITVNPTPTATSPGNQTYCNGVATTAIALSGTPLGVAFDLSGGASVGLANQTGINSIPVFTPIAGSATVTITPKANGCTGTAVTYVITVNSTPVFTACPSNFSLNTGAGACTAVGSYTATASGQPVPTYNYTFIGATTGSGAGTGSGSTFNSGTTNVTVTATNSCGMVNCNFTVTVTDNIPPVITGCPANISVNTGVGRTTCDQVASWTEPAATDNCTASGSLVWTKSHTPGTVFPVGTTTVTYTVKDLANNNSTCPFTVTVTDNTPPTFTAPNNIMIYSDNLCNYNAQVTITGQPNNEADNCPLGVIKATFSDGTRTYSACGGTSTVLRTWSLTDAHGNTTTHGQTITITDNIKPVLILPATNTIGCNASTLPANTGQATATDNCGGTVTLTYTDATVPGNCAGSSTITRTWTAIDCSGNSSSGNQTINVQDTTPPVLSCTSFSVANPSAIPASYLNVNLAATDNCGGPVEFVLISEDYTGLTGAPGFCPTSVIRKYAAKDQCGNISSECTQTITVQSLSGCALCQTGVPFLSAILDGNPDSLWTSASVKRYGICCGAKGPPPPECISFNVYLDKDAVGMIFNYSGASPSGSEFFQIDCGTPKPVGEVICLTGGRFYTVTFCKPGGNANTYTIKSISGITGASGLVTRQDAKCADILSVTGVDPATVTWTVKSPNDQTLLRYLSCTNCMNPMFTPDKFTPPAIVYQVCGTLLGFNQCNNTPMTDCKDVTVTILPVITIAFNINLGNICANNIPTINAAVTPINTNYTYQWFNGPDGTGTLLSSSPSWNPSAEGSYSLVVTETLSGIQCNTATYNFNIVYDVLGPTSIVPPAAPLVVQCNDPGAAQQIVNWLATATAFDGTVSLPVTNNYSGIAMACNQTITVTFSAADQCGNISTTTSTITITDTQVPAWTTIAGALNRTVSCSDAAGLAAAQALAPVATDLCDPTLTLTKTADAFVAGTCPNAGTYANTWTATDDCNNVSAVYTQTITITDTTPPVITTPAANQTVECDGSGNTAALNAWLANHGGAVATDACGGAITWTHNYSALSDLCGATGSATVTFTASDVCGNPSTTQATFTINDTQKPTFTAPVDVDVSKNATCTYDADPSITGVPNNLTDNCTATANLVVTHSDATAGGTCEGQTIITRTWRVTDACGNFLEKVQVITVLDNIPPTVACPTTGFTTPSVFNLDYATYSIPVFAYSDNCTATNDISIAWQINGPLGITSGIGIIPTPSVFNTGTSTINYTFTDACGNATVCSFTITVDPPPVITCPANIEQTADAGLCSAIVTIIPATAPGSGVTVSGVRSDGKPLTDPYPVGTTTITWTATNLSGSDVCTQTITVTDNQKPTFTLPPALSVCVESLSTAIYNPATIDINPDRPEYFIFIAGNNSLDLTGLDDNCCAVDDLTINWRIEFDGGGILTGTVQPSLYGKIQFPGDLPPYDNDLVHKIFYWVEDCNGNTTDEQSVDITIKPRPNLTKMP